MRRITGAIVTRKVNYNKLNIILCTVVVACRCFGLLVKVIVCSKRTIQPIYYYNNKI